MCARRCCFPRRRGRYCVPPIRPEDRLATIEMAAAQWTLDKAQPAGRGSDTLTASDWLFHPLRATDRTMAALGVARDDGRNPVRSDQLPLLMSLIDQAALVLDRMQIENDMRDVAELRERDRLRAALLSSVSHDLRTPLTRDPRRGRRDETCADT